MGGSKKQTVGYWYKILYHAGLSKGPIDAFLEFRGGDKTAWAGELTASGTININQPKLWGGEKDQGGIVSDVDVMFGESTQAANAYLLANLGAQVPAWRGLATLVFKGGKYGAMNPYPQKASYKIRKILQGWDGGTAWYPETAEVGFEVIPPGKLDWRYAVVETADATDYSAPVFDDSAWSVGPSPFGSDNDWGTFSPRPSQSGFSDTPATVVPTQKAVWMRGAFNLASVPTSGLSFHSFVDNGIRLYINGNLLLDDFNNAPRVVDFVIAPEHLQAGTNAIAVRGWDNNPPPNPDVNWFYFDVFIDSAGGIRGMNPAHILYFARTNSDLGREPTANISSASLTAAADTLYAEGFGICTTRDPAQESVEEFEGRITKLIDGSFSRDPITGLWHLDLARGDYVLGDLPILTDDDILDFKEIPSTLDNAINSVSVTYFDPEKKETITTAPVQARGLIAAFGTIHQTIEYPEIPTATLAARVALRELRATATPTRAFDLVCTRKPYAWRPNTYFRLQLPKRGIADMVCIVGEKESGSLKSGAIRLKAAQDIYSMPTVSFVDVEPGVDTTPQQTPVPITLQAAFEAPYIEVVATLSRADLDVLPADVGYLATVAAAPASGINYTVMVDAGAGYTETANGDWCPTATVVAASSWLDTAFTLAGGTRLDEVVVGSAALWDAEIVRVDAINPTTGAVTLARACADTLPAQHSAGSRIWFYQDNEAVDLTEYTDGETLNVKLLTNTLGQQVDIAAATAMPVVMDSRAVLPYPPANIQINGGYYPTADLLPIDSIVVAYAHRDRVLQADQLIDWTQASIGPEPGVTYSGKLAVVGGATLETIAGVTAATMTFSAPGLFDADLLLEIWSVRSTYESRHWSYQVHTAAGAPLRWAINRSYSYQVTAGGGTAPYTYAVQAGTLPTGLSLGASTGIISGSPSVAGDVTFTIRITDSLAAIVDQTFVYTTVADASWASVVALLPMDGADGSTTFTDLKGHTFTAAGNAQIDTAQSVFGGASGLFDGSSDYLTAPDSADWDFNAGDVTIEFRMRFNAGVPPGSVACIVGNYASSTVGWYVQFRYDGNGRLTFGSTGDSPQNDFIWSPAVGTWYHVAVSRASGTVRAFVGGAQIGGNVTNAENISGSTAVLMVGALNLGPIQYFNGSLDELRITKGVARYTTAFTPDDIPFPAG